LDFGGFQGLVDFLAAWVLGGIPASQFSRPAFVIVMESRGILPHWDLTTTQLLREMILNVQETGLSAFFASVQVLNLPQ